MENILKRILVEDDDNIVRLLETTAPYELIEELSKYVSGAEEDPDELLYQDMMDESLLDQLQVRLKRAGFLAGVYELNKALDITGGGFVAGFNDGE